jgi:hypothetical protein
VTCAIYLLARLPASLVLVCARRTASLVLVCAVVIALGAAPASAQCGETTNVSPRRSLGTGPPPLAVGDSVLYDAAGVLANYGFETNAMVCRTMAQGIAWLEAHGGNLPVLVVVALGTNGSLTTGQIDQLLTIVGPTRVLAMVTPHHGDYAYVPGLIRSAAQQHPGRILVLDWDRLSAGHPDWFAPDGIHLGGAAGVDAFARLVASPLLSAPIPAPVPVPTLTVKPPASAPTVKSPAPRRKSRPRPKPVSASHAISPRPGEVTRVGDLAWLVVSVVEELGLSLAGG